MSDNQLDGGYALLRAKRFDEAHAHANGLLSTRPRDPLVLVFASEVLLARRDPDGALDVIGRAIDASAGDPDLKLKKAALLAHVRRRNDAVALATAAARQPPASGRRHWQAASLLSLCNRHSLALQHCDSALALTGDSPALLYDKAVAQFFTGQLAEAEAVLDRLLVMAPAAGHAHYLRSTLRRQTPERNHVEQLKAQLARRTTPPAAEAAMLYALAKELEDLNEHDRSFDALSRAAARKRGELRYEVAAERSSMQSLTDAYSHEVMARLIEGDEGDGAIFIVGMPRTGTTLVERILVNNTGVKSAGELLDYGNLVALHTQRVLDAGVDLPSASASLEIDFAALGREYLRGAREAAGSNAFIDKMPVNFLYCGLIMKSLPRAKIIHVRRDPLDTCYAVYKTLFFNAYHFSYDLGELAEYYIGYERMMRHWHEVMPGTVLDVDYESLVAHPEEEGRRIFEWCGLPWDPSVLQRAPESAAFATASASQVREPIHQRSVHSSRRHYDRLTPVVTCLRGAGIRIDPGLNEGPIIP
jgi:tetratricopeptide (TPR) repeat protein